MAIALQEAVVQITRHRFTADEYQRMGEVGIFHPEARVELIMGEIVEMMGIGANHVGCVGLTTMALTRQVHRESIVFVQCPLRISNNSEPQPDFLVVRRDYDRSKLPTPPDTFLLIEVSDTSLAYDRKVKLPLYGAADVPEAWIFDLGNSRIERHTEPHANGYKTVSVAGPGEHLASTTLPGLTLEVDEVLGLPQAR